MRDFERAVQMVTGEYLKAINNFPTWNSAHEGYAIILEELDELWRIVKQKQKDRDLDHMKEEASQVAAMAIRFMVDICNEVKGRR